MTTAPNTNAARRPPDGGDRTAVQRADGKRPALHGIGPWTAEYISMRALRDPDGFPATDLGIRKALRARGEHGSPQAVSEPWRPWRGYAAMHLWESLAT